MRTLLLAESKDALGSEGLSIVHVPTDRDASVEQFGALAAAVARSAEDADR